MNAPYLYLTLWDDDATRADGTLAAVHERATSKGAQVTERSDHFITFSDYAVMSPVGEPTFVEEREDPGGGVLIEIHAALGHRDHDSDALHELRDEMLVLIDLIRPRLALVTVEAIPETVADLQWTEVKYVFNMGWVNFDRSSPKQRQSFERMRQRGLASLAGVGLWWSSWEALCLERNPEPTIQSKSLATTAFEAWSQTATPYDPAPVPPPSPPTSPRPELTFWRPDLPNDAFRSLTKRAAADVDVEVEVEWDDYGPGWHTAVTMLESRSSLTDQTLTNFQQAIHFIQPVWAAILSTGVDWPLGLYDEEAERSVGPPVSDLWIAKHWAPDILPELERLFEGAHRVEDDDGILWITTQSLVPDAQIASERTDKEINFDTEMKIAATLGRAMRRSIVELYGPQPGRTEARS